MAIDYGMDDGFDFAPEDAAQMGGVLMAKVTVKTTEIPGDYSGVKKEFPKTVEEIPIPLPGPAPMMMPVAPPGMPMDSPGMGSPAIPLPQPAGMALPQPMPAGMPMPGMPPMPGPMPGPMSGPGPGAGSMGVQAAQQVMQQFGQA